MKLEHIETPALVLDLDLMEGNMRKMDAMLEQWISEADIVTTDEAKRWLEGAEPKKIIVVPGKIVNIVVK